MGRMSIMGNTRSLGLFLFFICLLVFGAQLQAQGTRAIVIKAKKPALATPMNYTGHHALLIGVSDYDNEKSGGAWRDLPSIPRELDAIQGVLTSAGFEVTRIRNPNQDELKDTFENFIKKHGFNRGNRLLFYFAGHGHSMGTKEDPEGFLVPTDAPDPRVDEVKFYQKALPMSQILAWSRQMKALHALFLFDSCFSGTVFMSRALPEKPPYIADLTRKPVRQFISAGSAGQTVPARSIFAECVVEGLKGAADVDKDRYIIGTELGIYLQKRLAYYRTGQTPQYGKIRDPRLDKGDFVIRVPKQSISVPVTPIKPQVIQVPTVTAPSVDLNTRVDQILAQLASFDKQKQQALDIGYLATSSKVKRIDSARRDYLSSQKAFLKSRHSQVKAEYALLSKEMRPDALPMKRLKQRLDQLNRIFAPAASGGKVGDFVTNSIGMKLMYIPAGEFLMGSPASEDKRDDDETQHRVRLTKSFYMGSTEVTKGQFASFIAASSYRTEAEKYGTGLYVWTGSKWEKKAGTSWRSVGFTQEDTEPVVGVSWNDAMAFCRWLSQKEGKTYTLPTEAEWEYACRAGTTGPFHYGSSLSSTQANFDGNYPYGGAGKGRYLEKTASVGSYRPNAWGLYDMHGNVSEWCSDWYGDYPSGTVADPKGPASASFRVARVGCWRYDAWSCRSADRGRLAPDLRIDDLGFRVVLRSQ